MLSKNFANRFCVVSALIWEMFSIQYRRNWLYKQLLLTWFSALFVILLSQQKRFLRLWLEYSLEKNYIVSDCRMSNNAVQVAHKQSPISNSNTAVVECLKNRDSVIYTKRLTVSDSISTNMLLVSLAVWMKPFWRTSSSTCRPAT
jgi:hypothetical protein